MLDALTLPNRQSVAASPTLRLSVGGGGTRSRGSESLRVEARWGPQSITEPRRAEVELCGVAPVTSALLLRGVPSSESSSSAMYLR